MSPLKHKRQIRSLASRLGLGPSTDPVRDIVAFCEARVRAVLRDFPHCLTPAQLLDALANKLGTRFIVVRTDTELRQVRNQFVAQGEKGFALLEDELSEGVFGITIRRIQRKFWEPEFVSVIDCRDEKASRSYYTKWHEIGHLLITPDGARQSFRRTHCQDADLKDPEEAIVDVLAGTFGFFPDMVQAQALLPLSFEGIEEMRKNLCPEASRQAALIGIVKGWPEACMLVRAELALRRNERQQLQQERFEFREGPVPALRAVHVTQSDAAQRRRFTIFPNMRIPEQSVIFRAFEREEACAEAVEDLSSWESSDGSRLDPCKVLVKARFSWGAVDALITPLD